MRTTGQNNIKVVLSIKPEFAFKIFDGSKKFEFRKSIFKIEHSTSQQLLWQIDSFVLRNPTVRQAPKRYIEMRIVFVWICLLLYLHGNCQKNYPDNFKKPLDNLIAAKKNINDENIIEDSIYQFIGDKNNNWKIAQRYLVLSKDNNGRLKNSLLSRLDTNNVWQKYLTEKSNYHSNGLTEEYIQYIWDKNLNLNGDTLFYFKQDYFGNYLEIIRSYGPRSYSGYLKITSSDKVKYFYTIFDDGGYEIHKSIFEKFDNWKKDSDIFFKYNKYDNIIEKTIIDYRPTDYYNTKYYYDNKFNLVMDISRTSSDTTDLNANDYKKEYTYYDNNQLKVRKGFLWKGYWENQYEIDYKYENDLVVEETWIMPGYCVVFYKQKIYEYDNNNNTIHYLVQYKDLPNNPEWFVEEEYLYEYNEYNKKILEVYREDGKNSNRHIWIYDGTNIQEYIYQIPGNSTWENYYHAKFNYSEDDKKIEKNIGLWDNINQKWNQDELHTYQYDENKNLLEYAYYKWDSENGQWIKIVKYVYFWPNFSNIVLNHQKFENIQVFPNPSIDFIYAKLPKNYNWQKWSILDFSSRKVLSGNVNNNENLYIPQISELKHGKYMLIVKDIDEKVCVGKFIK